MFQYRVCFKGPNLKKIVFKRGADFVECSVNSLYQECTNLGDSYRPLALQNKTTVLGSGSYVFFLWA